MNYVEARLALQFWTNICGIHCIEQRQLVCKYNSTLMFSIFDEHGAQHNRLHLHALINNEKVASIYLDNMEVDFFSSRIKKQDKSKIQNWVEENKESLLDIKRNGDGTFSIPFSQLR